MAMPESEQAWVIGRSTRIYSNDSGEGIKSMSKEYCHFITIFQANESLVF